MSHVISVISGPDKGTIWNLDGSKAVIGRGDDCTFRLADASVSRHHSKIKFQAGNCFIDDLGSGNGTVVNGRPISSWARMEHGDLIMLGTSVLRYHQIKHDLDRIHHEPTSSTTLTLDDVQKLAQQQLIIAADSPEDALARISRALKKPNADLPRCTHYSDIIECILLSILKQIPAASRVCLVRCGKPDGLDKDDFVTIAQSFASLKLGLADIDAKHVAKPPQEACMSTGNHSEKCIVRALARVRDGVVWYVQIPVVWEDSVIAVIYFDGVGLSPRITNYEAILALAVVTGHAPSIARYF